MVNPVWPTSLPLPNRDGFRRGWEDPRTRRQREAGPPGYQRRYSRPAKPMTLVLDCSRDQFAELERFFEDDLQHGSLVFQMPDPITDGWPALLDDGQPWLDDDGTPILLDATLLMLWGDQPPEVTGIRGVRFTVVCPLWIMP
ncbi:hypothetical protein [Ensifer soli]|uniref:hypothetical protein n=1 Tax=Ciceribacter sp. sgz301302 TaxID=3342379 RepID=UPI0035B8685E